MMINLVAVEAFSNVSFLAFFDCLLQTSIEKETYIISLTPSRKTCTNTLFLKVSTGRKNNKKLLHLEVICDIHLKHRKQTVTSGNHFSDSFLQMSTCKQAKKNERTHKKCYLEDDLSLTSFSKQARTHTVYTHIYTYTQTHTHGQTGYRIWQLPADKHKLVHSLQQMSTDILLRSLFRVPSHGMTVGNLSRPQQSGMVYPRPESSKTKVFMMEIISV